MNWQMLLAIAAAAGDDVERRALATAKEIEGARTQNASNSLGIELLSDIRVVFDEEDESQLTTSTIIGGLVSMEEKPWSEYGQAHRPISPKQLARLLKAFGIHSREIHERDSHTKGYKREQFEDAWKRYLPPSAEDLPRSRANLDKSMAYDDFAAAREDDSARDEIRANSLNNK
jgi:hypothetical protein